MANLKTCLRDPIPEIFEAARLLDQAVEAHLRSDDQAVVELIACADNPAIRDWTNSLWGPGGPWRTPLFEDKTLPFIPRAERPPIRMPSKIEKHALILRDGFHCRFCGIPLIRMEVRKRFCEAYPALSIWGNKNTTQHAAFQAMWLQYDHLIPHARGGTNAPENMLITCAPCNYGRWHLTIAEIGLADPRLREPKRSSWDGLERLLHPVQ